MDKIPFQKRTYLRKRIESLASSPGVYIFKDSKGCVLYVGKALNLKKRVSSYFQKETSLSPRIKKLVGLVSGIETRNTDSEDAALILEAQLIKEYKPKYNIVFRDDKSYPFLKITDEKFPRLLLVREKNQGPGRYFGPYVDATMLRQAVISLRKIFPLRSCRRFPKRPCLEYHIGQCLAPCIGLIDEKRYEVIVKELAFFLEGKGSRLLQGLEKRMKQASKAMRFEEAALLRDQIESLKGALAPKPQEDRSSPINESLSQLKTALRLSSYPRRIEAFDISNIHGAFAVGSMVTFMDAKPFKAHYRHFKIKTVSGIDDYRMMREIIRRRYSGSLSLKLPAPDLILIDGGQGHLAEVLSELASMGLKYPAIGIAKKKEEIFLPENPQPICLLAASPVLHLIERVRDEAHRFAITYHRKLRAKSASASLLDSVSGIGPKRKAELLKMFGSITDLKNAAPSDIAKAAGISQSQAESLIQELGK
jgi:excinuclease ABC subunit C